ncbi:MAG: nitroreductase family protein [Chloroflexi bacterium]|nr:nitroreductase family protein [Chloroflexota bacterium]
MDVLEAIKARRSIRKYRPEPPDEALLEKVLEAARWAPSWANTQCWRFIVVREDATRARLVETLNATNPSRGAIRSAPVVIVACAELGKSGFHDGHADTDKGDWFMFDVALAMQNLALAAHSLGLATVHVGQFDAAEAARILEVPEGYCVVEMTPLGYPDQVRDPRPRKEISQIVFYEKFGNNRT